MQIMGISGMPGSGKGMISDMASERGAIIVSMGDIIREEAKKRGEGSKETAVNLRKEFGEYIVYELTIEKILGQRKRKHITEIELKNSELIAPAGSDAIKDRSVVDVRDYSTGYKTNSVYAIIHNDQDGQVKYLFEPTEKMLDAIAHIRPSIVKRNN